MAKLWLQLLKYFSELKPENALRLLMAVIIIGLAGWAVGLTKSGTSYREEMLKEKAEAYRLCEEQRRADRREKDSIISKNLADKDEVIANMKILNDRNQLIITKLNNLK